MTSMTNVIVGLVAVSVGLFFAIQSKFLASISQRENKKWLRLLFPLSSYEWGFRISGAFFVLVGIAFVVGVLRIKTGN